MTDSNTIVVEKKIVNYKVVDDKNLVTGEEVLLGFTPSKESVHEKMDRPERLSGNTYKIKSPTCEHAMYVTINDVTLNAGTEFEEKHPYEIFINSKELSNHQWVVALTRVMSAIFRKGGEYVFLIEEMKAIFDPKGGYFKKGKYCPSIAAEIGMVLEQHIAGITAFNNRNITVDILPEVNTPLVNADIKNATMCKKCNVKAVIRLDNCNTCVNCGDGKCG